VKVITDNREGWSKQVTCNDCNSMLEIEESDLSVGFFNGDAWERGQRGIFFECPLCEHQQMIEDLPGYIYRAVDKLYDRDGRLILK
jgi:primosomal protein N'